MTDNRFFDDLSRLATGAVGSLAGVGREMEALMRQQMERFIAGADLVRRDEFDAVKAMAGRALEEVEALKAEVAALRQGAAAPAAAAAKPRARGKATGDKA